MSQPTQNRPTPTIGFIGQGWVGKNTADAIESLGHSVVRYSLDEPFVHNKDKIKECDIVFIAVWTPTTPTGFDDSIVRDVVQLVGVGKIVVIKSTMLPGTTESIQKQYPDRIVLFSPEFLRQVSAADDARNPDRNIVGVSDLSDRHREAAELVMSILPHASYTSIVPSRAAELVKYASNAFLYEKVVFVNQMHDLASSLGVTWDDIKDAVSADPRIGTSHMDPVHDGARGAGGNCFIKDFAALRQLYEAQCPDDALGIAALRAIEAKNVRLLTDSNKSLDILRSVYGAE
jgi:nucleotide sugar dehydrogenase